MRMCARRVALSAVCHRCQSITPEVLMTTLSTQQKHSTNNNTATTTSSVRPMNRVVRVGAASITDEPEKTPAMIKPDLLPTTY